MPNITEMLNNPRYGHVLMNHLPVTGLAVAAVVLAIGLIVRKRPVVLVGLALVALLSLAAWPTASLGHSGEDMMQTSLYAEGKAWLEHHEHLAERWIWVFYATAAVAAVSFVLGCFSRRALRWAGPLTLLLTVGSLVAGTAIAEAGGKIAHDEFRFGPPPKQETEKEAEAGNDEDEAD